VHHLPAVPNHLSLQVRSTERLSRYLLIRRYVAIEWTKLQERYYRDERKGKAGVRLAQARSGKFRRGQAGVGLGSG
jgi:hypothetical protein